MAAACSLIALVIVASLSIAVGSGDVAWGNAWRLLLSPDGSQDSVVVTELRLPRTVVAVVVGLALGVAGAVMQALTRNPLAEPGLLGVNAGAALAVAVGIILGTGQDTANLLPWALMGAAAAAVAVYALAGTGRLATPIRLALAGVTVSAALAAITEALVLSDQRAFDEFRFWVAGSLEGRGWEELAPTWPWVLVGVVTAVLIGGALNAMALGDETARTLGVRPGLLRAAALVVVTTLAASATAMAGPIGFVGLAAPMLARVLTGSDHRATLVLSGILGAVWVLGADIVARVILAPSEVQVGIISALVGAPLFVMAVRSGRVAQL